MPPRNFGSITGALQATAWDHYRESYLSPKSAAVGGVPHGGNAHRVRAGIVVEDANGSTTVATVLAANGVLVVPDAMAISGGRLVSSLEWARYPLAYWWSGQDVDDRLERRMLAAEAGVLASAGAGGLTLRQAATVTAVERVTDAHLTSGLHP